jgi:methylphosphotriester-DNA--protein-cysteine methyltransferase
MMQLDNDMYQHNDLTRRLLFKKISSRSIQFAGNFKLKIFGGLSCASGKRMKVKNRVFFKSEMEAITMGFRPCGKCLRKQYQEWKANQ